MELVGHRRRQQQRAPVLRAQSLRHLRPELSSIGLLGACALISARVRGRRRAPQHARLAGAGGAVHTLRAESNSGADSAAGHGRLGGGVAGAD